MEERPPIWRVAANIPNKQTQTTEKGWSSSLWVGRGASNSFPSKLKKLRNTAQGLCKLIFVQGMLCMLRFTKTHTDSECTRMDQVGFSRKETVRVTSNKHKQLDKIEVGRTDGCRCDTTKLANTPTGCRIFPKIIYRCTFHRHTMWRRCKATIHGAEAA
jgi:hypothetical protein